MLVFKQQVGFQEMKPCPQSLFWQLMRAESCQECLKNLGKPMKDDFSL